jgi:uncharacterized protein (DUF2147 family)
VKPPPPLWLELERHKRFTLLLILIAAAFSSAARAEDLSSPEGLWTPLENGKPLGLVRIFEQDGAFFGHVEPSSPSDHSTARCWRCTGERKDQRIIGLIIMRNLKLKNGEYAGGDVLDPRSGHVYACKFHLVDGGERLRMRGYLGISLLGHSQTWVRVNQATVTAYWRAKEQQWQTHGSQR